MIVLDEYKQQFLDLFAKMIEIPAVNPSGGGSGEEKRAEMLKREITSWDKSIKHEEYVAISEGLRRPNNLFLLNQGKDRTVWIVGHIDTVSEGDLSLWNYPPFKATIEGDKVFGRGTCDNGQGVISSLIALKYFLDHRNEMKNNLGVILVLDEEAGSTNGIRYVLENREFGGNDKFIVPDSGSVDGSEIEVAEKGILWLKITVTGKQCHASQPDKGKNAHRLSRVLEGRLDIALHRRFNANDTLFNVPFSTFEPTKVEPGTTSINIIPGKESFFFDMRILPRYTTDEVFDEARNVTKEFEKEFGVVVSLEPVQKDDPSFNSPESKEFVQSFESSVKRLRNLETREIGVGGGTCGAFFRRKGLDTIVWGTLDEVEHMPNEYAKISNIFNDALVFIDFIKNY